LKRFYTLMSLVGSLLAAHTLAAQTVTVDKPSLNFSAQLGGAAVSQTVNVSSPGSSGSVAFLVSTPSQSWLTVSPGSGNTPSALTVTANPAGLSAGSYSASFSIGAAGGNVTVQATLAVSSISVSPQTLQFSYQPGGQITAQNLTISGQAVTFSTTESTATGGGWLEVNPASGNSPGTAVVTLNPAVVPSLAPGQYSGTITVTPTSGASSTAVPIPVSLTVTAAPTFTVSANSAALNYQIGGVYVPQQTVVVSTTGTQSVSFTATVSSGSQNWLTVSPTNATIAANGNTQLTIGYNTAANLPAGSYQGTITLSAPGASPSSLTINVTLQVSTSPFLYAQPSGTLTFNGQFAGPAPQSQNLTVFTSAVAGNSTTGQLPLAMSASSTGNWLTVQTTGVTGTPFVVSVNSTGLVPQTYNGTITVASNGVPNLTIPVSLVVSNNPQLSVNTNQLTFLYQTNGANNVLSQTLPVSSTTGALLNYTAAVNSGNTWLFLNGNTTATGASTSNLAVTVNPAGLSAGTYNGTITVNATNTAGAPVNPVTVPVVLYVSSAAMLAASPSSLTFTAAAGAAPPASQTITLGSTSATDQVTYTVTPTSATWLSIAPTTGTTPASLTVSALSSSLAAGSYSATITITGTAPGGAAVADNPVSIPVTLQVTQGTLALDKTTLTFAQVAGGPAPAAQTVNVTSNGQALTFTAAASDKDPVSWLSVTPATGTTPGALSISVDGSKLNPGTYQGLVTVVAPNGGNSPATITVNFTVSTASTISVTPANLAFAYTIGAAAPQSQIIQVQSSSAVSFAAAATTNNNTGNWLQVTPANGTTPGTLTVSINPTGLAAGNYTGTIAVTSPSAATPTTIPVTLTVSAAPPPTPVVQGITNAASYITGGVAPGEIVTIFGTSIGPATPANAQLTSTGTVATTIANTTVMFGNVAAPIINASATQTSVVVPYQVAGQPTVAVTVTYNGVTSAPVTFNVLAAQPGIFSLNQQGTGPGAILNQDGHTVNSASAPAPRGSVVAVYMTGEGLTSPAGVTGALTPSDGSGLKHPVLNPTATVGGMPATIVYAGSAPGFVNGFTQVNVQIPANAPTGPNVPIVITFGSTASTQPGVTVAVQ